MLVRYIGLTLITLGAAMLLAPDSPDRDTAEAASAGETAGTRASDEEATTVLASARGGTVDAARAVQAGEGRPEAAEARRGVPASEPGSATAAASPSLAIQTTRAERPQQAADLSIFDGIPHAERMRPPRGLDAGIEDAVAAAPIPSLSRPETIGEPAPVTPETLALITAASIDEADAAQHRAEPDLETLYVAGRRVNVRTGPSTSYSVIGSLGYGEAVELVANANASWAEVRLPDARTGFMSRNFLAPSLPSD